MAAWFIWFGVDILIFTSKLLKDEFSWQMAGFLVGNVILVIFVNLRGWKISAIDKLSIGAAAVGMLLWALLDNKDYSFAAYVAAAGIGCVPLYETCYREPEKESRVAWPILISSSVFSTIAIRTWSIQDALQPIAFLCFGIPTLYLLFIRGRKAQQPAFTAIPPSV
ncbi:hypothetical protein KBD18_00850 [Patescibacteria group bacterium]|nr:hypothetical protein [Patescibacteria group bacterium]